MSVLLVSAPVFPIDVFSEIASHCNIGDLVNLSKTCRALLSIAVRWLKQKHGIVAEFDVVMIWSDDYSSFWSYDEINVKSLVTCVYKSEFANIVISSQNDFNMEQRHKVKSALVRMLKIFGNIDIEFYLCHDMFGSFQADTRQSGFSNSDLKCKYITKRFREAKISV